MKNTTSLVILKTEKFRFDKLKPKEVSAHAFLVTLMNLWESIPEDLKALALKHYFEEQKLVGGADEQHTGEESPAGV